MSAAAFAIAGGAIGAQSSPDSAQRSAQRSAQHSAQRGIPPGAQANAPARSARIVCWQGRPRDRCRTFALFELSTQSHWVGSKLDPAVTRPGFGRSRDDDGLASHIVGDLGAMVNVGSRTAVGGTLTAGSVQARGKLLSMYGAVGRYRRWLTPSITADAGIGILRIPVGAMVRTERENFPRPALAADVRLGFRDLLSVTGRFMVATDGLGRTHHALFVGAATGSKITTTVAGLLAAVGTYYIFFGPRGDKVNVQ